MSVLFIILLTANISNLSAQNKSRVLQIRDSSNTPLGGVTGMYYDEKGKEVISTQSDLDGNIFLRNDFENLSLVLIGYKNLTLHTNALNLDSNTVVLETARYATPTLIINKATLKYEIDYSNYVSKVTVRRLDVYGGSQADTVYFDDGTFSFEISDTVRSDYDCRLATPNQWDIDYKNFYKLLSSKLMPKNLNIFIGDKASVEFQISRTGGIIIESINGVQSRSMDWLSSYLESWKWEPSDLYNKKVDTKHKMLIMLE